MNTVGHFFLFYFYKYANNLKLNVNVGHCSIRITISWQDCIVVFRGRTFSCLAWNGSHFERLMRRLLILCVLCPIVLSEKIVLFPIDVSYIMCFNTSSV